MSKSVWHMISSSIMVTFGSLIHFYFILHMDTGNVLLSLFYRWLSDIPSTLIESTQTSFRHCIFLFLCCRLTDYMFVGLNILWLCLSLGLEWKLTFSNPVATAEFSKFSGILSAALSKNHLLGFEKAQLAFHHLH